MSDSIRLVITISGAILAIGGLFGQLMLTKQNSKIENEEIKIEIEKVSEEIKDENIDIIILMKRNIIEMREYYVINKQQARNAFSSAIFSCILGFIIFVLGIIVFYFIPNNNLSILNLTTLSGGIIEVVSGLFFWLYTKSLKQINLFHESLQETQKFLTAIQISEKISKENQDETYMYIIEQIIGGKEKNS